MGHNHPMERLPKLGFLLLAVLSLLWGISWPMMKIALGEIRPWTFRSLCLILGGFGALALLKGSRLQSAIPKKELWPLLLVAFFNITSWHLCSAYGLIYMKAGRAVIIAYTMPVWASLLGTILLRERLICSRLIGLGLGMAGLAILIGPDIKGLGSAPLGAVFMLGSAISWAAGTVLIKYFCWTIPTLSLMGWQLILGGIPVVLGAFILEPISALSQVSWRGGWATAYVVILGNIFCNWAWIKVVQLFPASVAAIGTLLIPVVGVFSSALILGELIGLQEIAALILMIMALTIVMIRPKHF
jgi:drug/metabolite transporter (DMT)-like permease